MVTRRSSTRGGRRAGPEPRPGPRTPAPGSRSGADLVPVAKSIEDKLETVIHLVRPQYQIKETRRGIERYGRALDEIL